MMKIDNLFVSAGLVFMMLLVGICDGDSEPLQDLCVADTGSGMKVNGYACKNAESATPNDFSFSGLANPVVVNNTIGFTVTPANVEKVAGMNTLGISMSRIDFGPGGVNPPHTHPRASEVIFVLEGQLEVGFITTTGTLISKIINKGDIFVFPKALLHFQRNVQNSHASVLAAFNSQFPGTQSFTLSVFASTPPIPDDILTKTFQLQTNQIVQMRNTLTPKK